VAFLVSAVSTGVNVLVHPSVADRATGADTLDMLLYLLLFPVAGAVMGALVTLRPKVLRNVTSGGIAGALVWTYLTDTWTLTARAWSPVPVTSVPEAVAIGALLGSLGGLLLTLLATLRRART
jgi:hypothetical protein